jgi:hypothetical protein
MSNPDLELSLRHGSLVRTQVVRPEHPKWSALIALSLQVLLS